MSAFILFLKKHLSVFSFIKFFVILFIVTFGIIQTGHAKENTIWPVESTILSDTFGPRILSGKFDFHRGLDIPLPLGSPVYAIANGTVRLAGQYSFYDDPIVQIKHTSETGEKYYSNSMHMSQAVVSEGDSVTKGQLIGYSGASETGFEHLHFEIRWGGIYQKDCIHPLLVLPYEDQTGPEIRSASADFSNPLLPQVDVQVVVPASELDLEMVKVKIFSMDDLNNPWSLGQMVYNKTYYYTRLNRATQNASDLDIDDWNGITITPTDFRSSHDEYIIDFSFYDLEGVDGSMRIEIVVQDASGNRTIRSFLSGGG